MLRFLLTTIGVVGDAAATAATVAYMKHLLSSENGLMVALFRAKASGVSIKLPVSGGLNLLITTAKPLKKNNNV